MGHEVKFLSLVVNEDLRTAAELSHRWLDMSSYIHLGESLRVTYI